MDILDKKIDEELPAKCVNFVNHINSCAYCRNYILNNIKGYGGDYLMDVVIYAITGVFILLIVSMLLDK